MTVVAGELLTARRVHVRGVVQGVGFRPHVFRLAQLHALAGWVRNGDDGVHIHVEGRGQAVDAFLHDLTANAPAAARIGTVDVTAHPSLAFSTFEIRDSISAAAPTTRVSPDLAVCDDCVRELFDPTDHRFRYPYINCTNCGPRFAIVRALPYDRPRTTMAEWPMCERCGAEYEDPADRRFHAQPVACASCGPQFALVRAQSPAPIIDPIGTAAQLLRDGRIVAIKGIGGYHLACDARNTPAVMALRERKFRKEKPFALMVRDVDSARRWVWLTSAAEQLLTGVARPIVLCPARERLPGVAPDVSELGVMLPYAPLHHLLFECGAPDPLVMTSGNRSNEPIAYEDEDAIRQLGGIADAILAGERPIARRVDDSVVRVTRSGPVILRRSRGYAPDVVAPIPSARPILALGADLKNTITLVVDGEARVSQHIGDLEYHEALSAFRQTAGDLLDMHGLRWADLLVVHDAHPEYRSTLFAKSLGVTRLIAVQHHRAHVASVLAERGELERRVLGIAFDGTGYGDDGAIWGGELFAGSVRDGFARIAHLRAAALAGGDAAARFPAQAAAGFMAAIDEAGDLMAPPFNLPSRYRSAAMLVAKGVRSFATTSAGRLFDSVAALAGFTRPISYEGQAAAWLEHLASSPSSSDAYPMSFEGAELDWRPALEAVVRARRAGTDPARVARAFHLGLAGSTAAAAAALADTYGVRDIVLSGGVFQNTLLADELAARLSSAGLRVLTNSSVPPNDGGISLGQAALASTMHVD